MSKIKYEEIIQFIKEKNMDQALRLITTRLSSECIPLIKSKSKHLTHYESLAIFYYAFLDLSGRIEKGSFTYENESSFESYFKRSCVNQAYNFIRETSVPKMMLPFEIIELMAGELEKTKREEEDTFIKEKLDNYGIELTIGDEEETDITEYVIRAFHTLTDRCKFLIVFKFFLKMSHREIVDALQLFYEIKNENVSKTELNRCIGYIRNQVVMKVI